MTSPSIIHYVSSWLPLSQQFVHAQITSSKFRSVVVTREELSNTSTFRHPNIVRIAGPTVSFPPVRTVYRTLKLLRTAQTQRAALFHLHFGYSIRDVIPFVRLSRLPFMVSLHGHDVTALVHANPQYYGTTLARAHLVVVPSEFLAQRAIALGVHPERIRKISAGVDTKLFVPTPIGARPTILFVGRLVEKKGIEVLLEAWPAVLSRVPSAKLLVLGEGPLSGLVRGQRVTLIAPDHDRPRQQVADLIRDARVVVSPSRTARDGDSESCLLVNLEAMASGRPVVSTKHGGIPEFVIDGKTGILVPESDASALSAAIQWLATDLSLAQRLGHAGSHHARKYDAALAGTDIDALYDSLIAGVGSLK